ncbi:MAG: DUF2752 domain-containing protein [Defluviitaleaceae bacterium]|nr:DUF2752 domain-containing protein [Defluviitaleaceae bacterium]MCL2263674.1 DUF2752 domain-containing protein [Defluviitaleaceae bacterium]
MKNLHITHKNKIVIAVIIPILVFLFAVIYRGFAFYIFTTMPPCRLYYSWGLMCPGCGGTRSVNALVRGDIFTSFRLNPIVIFFGVLGTAFYTELIFSIFDKKIKIVPRSMVFLWVMIGLFSIFYVVRHFIPFFAI